MNEETQRQECEESKLERTIIDHLFLFSVPVGVLGTGLAGITEIGARYAFNADQSSVAIPATMAVGFLGGIVGGLCDPKTKMETERKMYNLYNIMGGLAVGSAVVHVGLNYLLNGNIF